MKFPRNARIFRGRLDVAPFAAVFFLLAIFLLLGSLVYTPGVRLELPQADDLPGTDKPAIAVAVDANGRFYFENQLISERDLSKRLQTAVKAFSEPPTLIIQADKSVRYELLIKLTLLARQSGIGHATLATLPRGLASPPALASP
jgi:biopolymer transport protein ExbD